MSANTSTNSQPIVWTVAASDSSAGAGIQADLATFAHFEVHGCSIISKITAQNSHGIVATWSVPQNIFVSQIEALAADLPALAIKISVFGEEEQLGYLSSFLSDYNGFSVYDPVFLSSTDVVLTGIDLIEKICQQLLPHISLITPNIPEAELLTKVKINTYADFIQAGKQLLQSGVKNVLIKGGHFSHDLACDLFINVRQHFWLISPVQGFAHNVHGTGCHLSSAIAANIALGHDVPDAVILAKRYLNSALEACQLPLLTSGQYYLPQCKPEICYSSIPKITTNLLPQLPQYKFLSCTVLGLYPIVDSSSWIDVLAQAGVTTIQLRIKETNMAYVELEVIKSIQLARKYKIHLFINDYWQLAIKYGAYGVHLGQEDLLTADVEAISRANLRLGISTHSYYELAIALAYSPSYIALGPIFPTTSKVMPWQPQGINRLREWQAILAGSCQLVAIGGINLTNISQIVKAGARNIALISGITGAVNPLAVTTELLAQIHSSAAPVNP